MRRPRKQHEIEVVDRAGRTLRRIRVFGRPPRPFLPGNPDEVMNLDRKLGLQRSDGDAR